jgi:hypothetical protein
MSYSLGESPTSPTSECLVVSVSIHIQEDEASREV